MPPAVSRQPFASKQPFWKVIDWRLVAACGLPVWAFIFGLIVAPRAARVAQASPAETSSATSAGTGGVAEAPMPREIVVRTGETEVVSVPVVVPVPVPGESVPVTAPVAANFQLPASELVAGDRCKTFDTKVRFHPTLADAADEAKKGKKMLFVLHLSGDLDDPGFT